MAAFRSGFESSVLILLIEWVVQQKELSFSVTDPACPYSFFCRCNQVTLSKTPALSTTLRTSQSWSVLLSTLLASAAAVVDSKTIRQLQHLLDPVGTLQNTRQIRQKNKTCPAGPFQSQLLVRMSRRNLTNTRLMIRDPALAPRPFQKIKQQQSATLAPLVVTTQRSSVRSRTWCKPVPRWSATNQSGEETLLIRLKRRRHKGGRKWRSCLKHLVDDRLVL